MGAPAPGYCDQNQGEADGCFQRCCAVLVPPSENPQGRLPVRSDGPKQPERIRSAGSHYLDARAKGKADEGRENLVKAASAQRWDSCPET